MRFGAHSNSISTIAAHRQQAGAERAQRNALQTYEATEFVDGFIALMRREGVASVPVIDLRDPQRRQIICHAWPALLPFCHEGTEQPGRAIVDRPMGELQEINVYFDPAGKQGLAPYVRYGRTVAMRITALYADTDPIYSSVFLPAQPPNDHPDIWITGEEMAILPLTADCLIAHTARRS